MKFIYGLCLALCIASAQASSLMGGTAPSLGSGDVNQTASSEPTGPAYLVLYEGGNKSSLVADVKANDLAYITSRHCKYGSCVTKLSKGRMFGTGTVNGGSGYIANGSGKRYYTTEVLIVASAYGSVYGPPAHSNTTASILEPSITYYCALIFDHATKRFSIKHDATIQNESGCASSFFCAKKISLQSSGSKCNGSGISKVTVLRNGA